jgi:flagellar hook-associated protein 3 FlgL
MRIAQRTIYSNMLDHMQSTLGAYMESNIQGSSQKKVNRPSDDPAGTARILNYRASLALNKQHRYNADTADGWLKLADETLGQVSTVISKLMALAEQGSTGTYSTENRLQMSYEARSYFGQLLNLANTKFENQHIFGGQKYDIPAYQEGLGITTGDEALGYDYVNWEVTGSTERSIMVRFPDDITLDSTGALPVGGGHDYEWSDDGGENWNKGKIKNTFDGSGNKTGYVLETGSAQITIPLPTKNPPYAPLAPTPYISFKAYDPVAAETPEGVNGFLNGSQLIIRPAAYYMGDDNDPPQVVENFGTFPTTDYCSSTGNFSGDVRIRIEPDPYDPIKTLYKPGNTPPDTIYYSYSTDNGLTWIPAHTTVSDTGPTRLIVPGGFLDIGGTTNPTGSINPFGTLDFGQQFVIRPRRADLGYEIMPGQYISVNNVGKDIFGGLYQDPTNKYSNPPVAAQPVFGDNDARNLFEVASNLIAFLECGNQTGVQQCLADLKTAHQVVLTAAAKVGGKENRLEITKEVLSYQKLDKEERLSYVEDVDLTELLTRLAQQELAYSTVLKSSAMIMQLNLTKFI